jgi:hypothetical protein
MQSPSGNAFYVRYSGNTSRVHRRKTASYSRIDKPSQIVQQSKGAITGSAYAVAYSYADAYAPPLQDLVSELS